MKYNCVAMVTMLSFSCGSHIVASQQCDEKRRSSLKIYAIPGQNGFPGREKLIDNPFGQVLFKGKDYFEELFHEQFPPIDVTHVPTPRWFPDFGQYWCIRSLQQSMHNNRSPYIIHASAHGTATALNHIAQNSDKMQACILEACMASGNSTICHTASHDIPDLNKASNFYYWLPYVAKCSKFPFYAPSGKQAIKSIERIRDKGPFIIIHAEKDPRTPYVDAYALYYGLRKNNNIVYFMTIKSEYPKHLCLLHNEVYLKSDLLRILKKHKLLHDETLRDITDKELEQYQPDHELSRYKKAYEDLVAKERMHEKIYHRVVLPSMAALCAATSYYAYRYFGGR